MSTAPTYSWEGYGKRSGIPNSYIEAEYENPRRIDPGRGRSSFGRVEAKGETHERTPEQRLAAGVLFIAWQDATNNFYRCNFTRKQRLKLASEAQSFLTAPYPHPLAVRRQLFTSALNLDDEVVRQRALRRFGKSCLSAVAETNSPIAGT